MAIDSRPGRSYKFYHDAHTVSGTLTVTAWDPARGWRLAGQGFSSEWIPFTMFRSLLREGVLVDC